MVRSVIWATLTHMCGVLYNQIYWIYTVIQQVSDLGFVDLDLDVPTILPSCFAHSAYLSSVYAEVGRQ